MRFITSYIPVKPNERVPRGKGRHIDFDFKSNKISRQTVYFCEATITGTKTHRKYDFSELGSKNFLTALKKSNHKEVVLFIHGFNNDPIDDIFPRAIELQGYFDKLENDRFEIVPVIWPCDDDFGVVLDYLDDQFHAAQSAAPFSRAMSIFLKWYEQATVEQRCAKKVHLIAHSMGNRALMFTFDTWSKKAFNGADVPTLFQTIVNMAADIPNEALERDKQGWFITRAANEVVVFHAPNDLALKSSKVVNTSNGVFSRRLGDTGPENMGRLPNHVYAIDCRNHAQTYDAQKGHTYFYGKKNEPGVVCKKLFEVFAKGADTALGSERAIRLK